MLPPELLRLRLLETFKGSKELVGLPPKTRAKRTRELACKALGWPVPSSFPLQTPRFPQ